MAVQAALARRSVRAFLPTAVPRSVVEDLLTVAARAPSGGNTQPWHVYALAGQAKAALSARALAVSPDVLQSGAGDADFQIYPPKESDPELHRVYLARRIKLAEEMWGLMGVDRKDKAARAAAMQKNFEFFGAPVGLILTVDRAADRNGWGHAGMFLQTLFLASEERGLATCPLESWGNLGDLVYETVGIDRAKETVWCGVALGFADPDARVNTLRTHREPVQSFSRFSGFDSRL